MAPARMPESAGNLTATLPGAKPDIALQQARVATRADGRSSATHSHLHSSTGVPNLCAD
jgi:hypothetical protein